MKKMNKVRSFLKDNNAISEEFTVLPALSIVMIGFALFIAILAQTYILHSDYFNRLQNYQTAGHILQKLTNPDCYFIHQGGVIDLRLLQNDTASLQKFSDQYTEAGVQFFLRLNWKNHTMEFPEPLVTDSLRCVAVSSDIGITLNEAQTIPGKLTIFFLGDS